MPYLVSGGGELVKGAGETLAEKAPEWIKGLWDRLRPKVEASPAAADVVQDVAKAPEDAGARASLQHQLKKILEADPALATEVARLIESAGPKISYHAVLHGSGAIGQGTGNVVAGAGGTAAGGSITRPK